jgi:hypothetical protein
MYGVLLPIIQVNGAACLTQNQRRIVKLIQTRSRQKTSEIIAPHIARTHDFNQPQVPNLHRDRPIRVFPPRKPRSFALLENSINTIVWCILIFRLKMTFHSRETA